MSQDVDARNTARERSAVFEEPKESNSSEEGVSKRWGVLKSDELRGELGLTFSLAR